MSKKRVKGHKDNVSLNRKWASHVKKWWKYWTAKKRRIRDQKIIKEELYNLEKPSF